MLPKDGDLTLPSNWRPIAILPIMYKLFARMVYNRIAPSLFNSQSKDQHAFTSHIRLEDALVVVENVVEYALEFDTPNLDDEDDYCVQESEEQTYIYICVKVWP